MSFVIEMESPLNLDTLPPDIIRRIIRLGQISETTLRLISHSWNFLGKYFAIGTLPDPLERLYLHTNVSGNAYLVNEWQQETRVTMYAICAQQYSSRVGVGSWLRVFDRDSGSSVEVSSERMPIAYWNGT